MRTSNTSAAVVRPHRRRTQTGSDPAPQVIQLEITFQPPRPPARPSTAVHTEPAPATDRGTHSHLRCEVNRLVGVVVGQSGHDYRSVWVLAYHRLFKRTGIHVVARAASEGTRDQLGFAESQGLLSDLIAVLADMLVDDKYAPA